MKKLLPLALLGGAAWWLFARRREPEMAEEVVDVVELPGGTPPAGDYAAAAEQAGQFVSPW